MSNFSQCLQGCDDASFAPLARATYTFKHFNAETLAGSDSSADSSACTLCFPTP